MAKKKVQRTLLNSIWSPKKLSDYLESKFNLYSEPSTSRWGIISTCSTVFSFLIALGIAFWAIAIGLFGIWGYKMLVIVIVLASIAAFLGVCAIVVGICGLVLVARLGNWWLKNPRPQSVADLLINGAIDGMAGEPLPRNNKRVHSKIRNLGNRIGKHAKAIMDKRENENEKTTTRESKRDSKA